MADNNTENSLLQGVKNGIEKYQERRRDFRGKLLDGVFIRYYRVTELYPNPDDEFSMREVGPSDRIIEDYCKQIRMCKKEGIGIFPEEVYLKKIKERKYMILNGHHRWSAAKKSNVSKIRGRVVE